MARAYFPFFILLLLNSSQAQLTGTLTRSLEDLEILMAVITNTGSRHVSVLKHNNIFDTSHMSFPFKITDSAGNRLPMGGSRIHYSGMSNDDLLNLAPGCNFTRHFNLTDYVDLGSELGTSKTITISLPSTFRGLKGHNGAHQIHPATEGPLLTGVSHSTTPLQLKLPVPIEPARMKKRQSRAGGIALAPNHQCSVADAAKLSTAILHASYLAGAALNAASSFGDIPFNYFFPANTATVSKVAGVLTRVQQSQQGQGQVIRVTCNDFAEHCVDQRGPKGQVTPAYAAQARGYHPTIVFCPAGLTLPVNPPPCSQPPGTVSIGWIMLHEMVHIQSISGPVLDIFDETGQLASSVGNAVKAGQDTTTDANAYSYLGTWSWDLGLGGQPWNQKQTCLERFSTGNFNANPFLHNR
ncbi:MAG: hypothetical protein M1830_004798 [Pleopsidium flavum]|nr:MAG: hypothetical protein M1830_004798 [Pleopsidium flavum]